jgi:hypothetical protein
MKRYDQLGIRTRRAHRTYVRADGNCYCITTGFTESCPLDYNGVPRSGVVQTTPPPPAGAVTSPTTKPSTATTPVRTSCVPRTGSVALCLLLPQGLLLRHDLGLALHCWASATIVPMPTTLAAPSPGRTGCSFFHVLQERGIVAGKRRWFCPAPPPKSTAGAGVLGL